LGFLFPSKQSYWHLKKVLRDALIFSEWRCRAIDCPLTLL